jgi:hypothetical protein
MLDIKDSQLEEMLEEAPGSSQLNFTMFLTLFGEKLTGTDPELTIKQAFECFDEPGLGKVWHTYIGSSGTRTKCQILYVVGFGDLLEKPYDRANAPRPTDQLRHSSGDAHDYGRSPD